MSRKENIIELEKGSDGCYSAARVVSEEKPKKERKPKAQKTDQTKQIQAPVFGNEKADNFINGIKFGLHVFKTLKKIVG